MKKQIKEAILEGMKVRGNGTPACGAGRAYVCMCKVDRKTLNAYKAAIESCGMRYLKKAYGAGDRAIYVGYDNFTGVPLAQAEAIAKNLKDLGLPAYFDAVGD